MNRFWSILFFLVPTLAIATFVMAGMNIPPLDHCRLPSALSESGESIDFLFNGLHYLSAIILIGTGITIGLVIWKFDHRRNPNGKAHYIHHNSKLEATWSIIPGFILVFIAFYQMNSWSENKMQRPTIEVNGEPIPKPPLVMVKAKQFGWEFHYAGADGIVETRDDIFIENLLVAPADEDVVLQLESRDVIHSFYVPELRLKQDIVPGMTQFSWFNARATDKTIEIFCTELCGWGHYKMKADLRIVPRNEFDQWLADLTQKGQPQYQEPAPDTTSGGDDSSESTQ